MKNGTVANWMTTDVITIKSNAKLPEADELMMLSAIRRLPVIDPINHKLVGILTVGDIRGASPSEATTLSVWEISYLINRLEVREFMSKEVITIQPDCSIEEAAKLMLDNQIAGLPVVNDIGELVGIITESDIFRLIVTHGWEEVAAVV